MPDGSLAAPDRPAETSSRVCETPCENCFLMVEIEGQGNPEFRKSVWVKIEEGEPANWSLGGMKPTAEMIATTFGPIGHDGRRMAKA